MLNITFLYHLIIVLSVFLFVSCRGDYSQNIIAEKGNITLSNYDFQKGIIPLDYDWEFYWNRLYSPEDFIKTEPVKSGWIKVPGVWNGYDYGSGKAGRDGFATYRFTVKNIPAGSYGLKISTMATAYKLWVNGKFLSSNGIVATDNSMVPQQMPGVVLFDTAGEDVVITVQVSNFMTDKGGIWGKIYLGSADRIIKERLIAAGIDLMLFGSFFIMALYHFCLYAFRRQNRFTLFFGLGCLVIATRIILTGEFFLVYIFPDINWNVQIKLEFLTVVGGSIFLLMFLRELFKEEFSDMFILIFQILSIVFTLITIILPVKIAALFLPGYHLVIVCGLLYIIYALVHAVRNGREDAFFIMGSYVVLMLALINDILDSNNIIHTGYFLPYGLFLFILPQSIILSRVFFRSFTMVEQLSGELQILNKRIDEDNKNLESMIEARTSELSAANNRLHELDRAKSDFFANISHEFRTPLTLMLAPIDEALSGVKLNRDTFEMMHRNGKNLLSLITDLLDISRITAGRMILEVAETDIAGLIRQFCDDMKASAKLKNIDLTYKLPDSNVYVYIDQGRIANIISNFFSNSFKFTNSGGRIELNLSDGNDYVIIKFTDTGCGIEADKLDIIFDRFSQADTGSTRRYEGTGIGLSLVKELVELHGGEVSVESRHISEYPDNHGTTFTVKLRPGRDHFEGRDNVVYIDNESEHLSMPYVRGIDSDMSGYMPIIADDSDDIPSMLIVEDNDDIRRLLLKMLGSRYIVHEASNGLEAVAVLQEKDDIDLVISDIMMPGMDGHELIRWIRGDERFEGLPVLFLTARAENFMKIEGLDLGAIDYVTKPFNIDELILRIRNQIELKKLRNSLLRNYEIISAKLRAVNLRTVTGDNVSKIETICGFIKEHYMEELLREDLAAAVELNPDTFSRLFNLHTGSSLLDYMNELRIKEAMRRLKESDETITRISISTGFDNIRTFNRVFKKFTGMTPGEFRDSGAYKPES
jgi:signal transduction histidine kinase/AraC-like DNA-binding protein